MIVVTHEMGFARRVGSRVLFFHEGQIADSFSRFCDRNLALLSLDTAAALVDVQHLMERGEIARRIARHYQHIRLAARGKPAGHISNPD